ncbi:MAG: hypothetical protein ACR2FM_04095 [Candidatus Saccharimonadales bacterium]
MQGKNKRIIVRGGVLLAALVIVFVAILANRSDNNKPVNTNQQTSDTTRQSDEQISEQTRQQQESLSMQPDINNEEFTLTGSTVNCSTTEVNGAVSQSCSGNIRIVPTTNQGMSAGLYKINEQTRLLQNGEERDLATLQQLSQNQTLVRLTLVDGSSEMLKEIRY